MVSKAKHTVLFFLLVMSGFAQIQAQEPSDTTVVTNQNRHEEKNRNVMLNATSSSKPREISTGLPGDDSGTAIFEDGMPVSVSGWPAYPYFHWAGGNSYGSQTLLKMEDVALRSSRIGFAINSFTQLGGDKMKGAFTASSNNNGLIRFDGNLNGPLGHGFYYTGGVYLNYDPTSVHPSSRHFINQAQIYKMGITKRWNEGRGELSLLYKYAVNKDGTYGYNTAPFYYVGDGSIKRYKGFKLGRDCYFPDDDHVTYRNVVDGKMVTDRLGKMNTKRIHDLTARIAYDFTNDWKLEGNFHMSYSGGIDNLGIYESGVDAISQGKDSGGNSMTLSTGTAFDGPSQNMLVLLCHSHYLDLMANVSMKRKFTNHELEFGLNNWFDNQYQDASTLYFAHTIENDPARIYHNGSSTWGFNNCAEYYDGHQNILALYAIDDWSVNDRLDIYYGTRMEWMGYKVTAPTNLEGEHFNDRVDNFYVQDGTAALHVFEQQKINPVALANVSYRLFDRLFLSGEYLITSQHKSVGSYATAEMPDLKPVVTQLGRFGILYDNTWFSLTSMVSYITGQNNSGMLHFTKQINGVSETQAKQINFNIGTFGWTTDVAMNLSHFSLHFLATLQNPEYRNFSNNLTFSDGSSETIDYSGNYVSGISRVLLEIDPSYKFNDKWRCWFNARYFSRQYANRVNNAYFNGHWETFAGVSWQTTKHLLCTLDIVNLLNQTGANGTLDVADTITDSSLLHNYLTSGTYIRPLTIGLTVRYQF